MTFSSNIHGKHLDLISRKKSSTKRNRGSLDYRAGASEPMAGVLRLVCNILLCPKISKCLKAVGGMAENPEMQV